MKRICLLALSFCATLFTVCAQTDTTQRKWAISATINGLDGPFPYGNMITVGEGYMSNQGTYTNNSFSW